MGSRMQCKDIPDLPILEFLAGPYDDWDVWGTATWFGDEYPDSVTRAMPADIDDRLILAKMRSLMRRGLVQGCGCGCRGDFEITEAGRAHIRSVRQSRREG